MAQVVSVPVFRRWPWHGALGLLLVAVAWPLAWAGWEPWSRFTFFPLWLGYILTMDAIVLVRRGSSLFTRSPKQWALLFLLSMPFWWAFEFLNIWVRNWEYLGTSGYKPWEYALLASINFSTVLPAVMETGELVASFRWVRRLRPWRVLVSTKPLLWMFVALGVLSFVLPTQFPRVAYPLVWGVLFFLLEPLNVWTGAPTLFDHLRHGDWRPVVALGLGTLICGFFWEMWNINAYPKWVYHVPGFDRWPHLFEMPLPGFIGYLPFGLELYAMMHMLLHLLRQDQAVSIRLVDEE